MFMPHAKASEYGAGFIPAAVLIGAVFIESLRNNVMKKLLVFFVVLVCFFQYIELSYDNAYFFKFNVVSSKIKYFNPVLIYYDKKDADFSVKTMQYIKEKYKNKSFCIEDCPMFNSYDKSLMTATLLKLNGFDTLVGYVINASEFFNKDILIIIGKSEILDGTLDERIKRIQMMSWLDMSYIIKTENIFNKIKQTYKVIDEFYPFGVKDDDLKVTLLAQKKN